MKKIDRIRKILAEQQAQKDNKSRDKGPSAVFPFWNMDGGGTSLIRFLPDGNTNNDLFWIERNMINLEFPGIKGQDASQYSVRFQVPCAEMWGISCPVLSHIRSEGWFNDKATEKLGSQYWKKRSWIMQGFVVDTDLEEKEDEIPENSIRRFIMGRQLFEAIRAGTIDPEMLESPDDYENGTDFYLMKTKSSGDQYANYSTSKWSRNSRPLTEDEKAAVETHGLSDLSSFLPKQPTDDELKLIFELFTASVAGDDYDSEKFGHLPWKPYGLKTTDKAETASGGDGDAVTSTPETETATVPVKSEGAPSADDILKRIRAGKTA